MKLFLQTVASMVFGVVFFGLALFWPAGTFDYWQAWVFIAAFMVATMGPSIYMAVRYPDALRRRMRPGPFAETRTVQKVIIVGIILAVVAVGWSARSTIASAGRRCRRRLSWSATCWSLSELTLAELVVIRNNYAAVDHHGRGGADRWYPPASTALCATRCTSER